MSFLEDVFGVGTVRDGDYIVIPNSNLQEYRTINQLIFQYLLIINESSEKTLSQIPASIDIHRNNNFRLMLNDTDYLVYDIPYNAMDFVVISNSPSYGYRYKFQCVVSLNVGRPISEITVTYNNNESRLLCNNDNIRDIVSNIVKFILHNYKQLDNYLVEFVNDFNMIITVTLGYHL